MKLGRGRSRYSGSGAKCWERSLHHLLGTIWQRQMGLGQSMGGCSQNSARLCIVQTQLNYTPPTVSSGTWNKQLPSPARSVRFSKPGFLSFQRGYASAQCLRLSLAVPLAGAQSATPEFLNPLLRACLPTPPHQNMSIPEISRESRTYVYLRQLL